MEQAEKAAAESEAKGGGTLRLEEKRGIVQAKFFEGFAQLGVGMCIDGIEPRENHGLDFLEAGQSFERRVRIVSNGVADFRVSDILDVGDDEADFSGDELVDLDRLGSEDAESFGVEGGAVPPQTNSVALFQRALKYAGEDDHATISVEPGVENQRLKPVVGRAFGRGHALHNRLEDVGNSLSSLGANEDGVRGIEADRAFDHFFGARNVGALQIDFVDDRNNFEPVIDCEIRIGKRLGFDALRGIDDKQRALARSQGARHFVGKIHVARRVDQVELIRLTVLRGVGHADGVSLDGDAAFALQVHGIEHLGLHLAGSERPGKFQQAVRQRGLAVVDVRDDREIADESGVHG